MEHDLLQVGSPKAVTFHKSFRVHLFEAFIVILDALVEGSQMGFSRSVDRADVGHGESHHYHTETGA